MIHKTLRLSTYSSNFGLVTKRKWLRWGWRDGHFVVSCAIFGKCPHNRHCMTFIFQLGLRYDLWPKGICNFFSCVGGFFVAQLQSQTYWAMNRHHVEMFYFPRFFWNSSLGFTCKDERISDWMASYITHWRWTLLGGNLSPSFSVWWSCFLTGTRCKVHVTLCLRVS